MAAYRKIRGSFSLGLLLQNKGVVFNRQDEDAILFTQKLRNLGFRAESDTRGEKIGYKIREAQLEKVPYMVIIGDKEKANNTISVRSRQKGDMGVMTKDAFILTVRDEVDNKVIN